MKIKLFYAAVVIGWIAIFFLASYFDTCVMMGV